MAPGFTLTDHSFGVPLRHDDPNGEQISIYAREVRSGHSGNGRLPYLLMLNGGPGFPCYRVEQPKAWLERALRDYHVLLLDQRGTGLSSPLDRQTLDGLGPEAQAERLRHFRADSIVR